MVGARDRDWIPPAMRVTIRTGVGADTVCSDMTPVLELRFGTGVGSGIASWVGLRAAGGSVRGSFMYDKLRLGNRSVQGLDLGGCSG